MIPICGQCGDSYLNCECECRCREVEYPDPQDVVKERLKTGQKVKPSRIKFPLHECPMDIKLYNDDSPCTCCAYCEHQCETEVYMRGSQ